MAQIIEVFQKGDAYTPQRFWSYALRTETKHAKFYDNMGYIYSEKNTKQYTALSDEEKKKVNFTYINGIRQ